MGFRFRRSMKVLPGVRVNVNKDSLSVSVGPRGAKVTVNTKGGLRKTVGLPGSGLSYTTYEDIKKDESINADNTDTYKMPVARLVIIECSHCKKVITVDSNIESVLCPWCDTEIHVSQIIGVGCKDTVEKRFHEHIAARLKFTKCPACNNLLTVEPNCEIAVCPWCLKQVDLSDAFKWGYTNPKKNSIVTAKTDKKHISNKRIENLLSLARDHEFLNDFDEAVSCYKKVLHLDKENRKAIQGTSNIREALRHHIYLTGISKNLCSSETKVNVYRDRIVLVGTAGETKVYYINQIRNPRMLLGAFTFNYEGEVVEIKLEGVREETKELLTFIKRAQKGIYPKFDYFAYIAEKEETVVPVVGEAYEPEPDETDVPVVGEAYESELDETDVSVVGEAYEPEPDETDVPVVGETYEPEPDETDVPVVGETYEPEPDETIGKEMEIPALQLQSYVSEEEIINEEPKTNNYLSSSQDCTKKSGLSIINFKGRLNRKPFLIQFFTLWVLLILFIGYAKPEKGSTLNTISMIVFFSLIPLSMWLFVRRLHDLNHTGWWSICALVPYLNIVFAAYLFFFKGTNGSNKYGQDPLEENNADGF